MALALGCLLGKWPWPWGACWGRCLEGLDVLEGVWRVWKVLEGLGGLEGFGGCLEGLEGFGAFGEFWSFGAFGVFVGWQTAALKANNRKPLLWPWPRALALGCLFKKWPWPWGACGGRCLEGLEGLDGFGGFGIFASP